MQWYDDFINYLGSRVLPSVMDYQRKKKFFHDLKQYYWDEPLLIKRGVNDFLRRRVPEEDMESVITHRYASLYGGHASTSKTAPKILQVGLYRRNIFKDVHTYFTKCDQCQCTGNIFKRNEIPLKNIPEVEIFGVWSISFMASFISSMGNKFILVAVDYVSKCVEYIASLTNDA